jgi:hypothetical protein
MDVSQVAQTRQRAPILVAAQYLLQDMAHQISLWKMHMKYQQIRETDQQQYNQRPAIATGKCFGIQDLCLQRVHIQVRGAMQCEAEPCPHEVYILV